MREAMLPEDDEPQRRIARFWLIPNLADVRKRCTALLMAEDNSGSRQLKAGREQEERLYY
jgi:hypothetical protein